MAVIEYAVSVLEVNHIVVCGHYGFGGIGAVIKKNYFGYIKRWLNPLKNIYEKIKKNIQKMNTMEEKINYLSVMNVIHQVEKLKAIGSINVKLKKKSSNTWNYL